MVNIPIGYKTYERILWADLIENHSNTAKRVLGPPTVSNLLAHILTYRDRKIFEFDGEPEDVEFRVLCRDFRKIMIPNYINEKNEVVTLTSENSMVINKGYYKRNREERIITVNNKGYNRFSYLHILNKRSKEVLKEFDISSKYYDNGEIIAPVRTSGGYITKRIDVVKFDDRKKADLPREAQRKLELDDEEIKDYADWFSGSDKPVYRD